MLPFSGTCSCLERATSPKPCPFPQSSLHPVTGQCGKFGPLTLLATLWRAVSALELPKVLTKAVAKTAFCSSSLSVPCYFFSSLVPFPSLPLPSPPLPFFSRCFFLRSLLSKLSVYWAPSLDLLSGKWNLQPHWHLKCLNFSHVESVRSLALQFSHL